MTKEGIRKNVIDCPLCGKKKAKFYLSRKIKSPDGKNVVFNLFKCCFCSLFFIYPKPSNEVLRTYYLENYYSYEAKIKSSSFGDSPLSKYVLHKYYGYKHIEIKNAAISHKFLAFFLKTLFFNIPSYVKDGRILDIGCGSGDYLYKLNKIGWQIYGLDINEDASSFARDSVGADVYCGNIFDASYPDNFFNVVTMWHTLEHIDDPLNVLIECKRIMKNDGQLFIGVPNTDSLEFSLLKEKWMHLDMPRHLFDFQPKNLEILLEKAGFEIRKIKYPLYGSHGFLVSLDNSLRGIGLKLSSNKIFKILAKLLYLPIILFKKGGCVELYAKNK